MTSADLLKQAENELWAALQALKDNDLPFVRSSSMRAANYVTEAWQNERRNQPTEKTK